MILFRRSIFLLAVLSLVFLTSCAGDNSVSKFSAVKRGVSPVADPEVAVIEMEEPVYGKITIELYSNIAPEMVKRFKELAREGVYNGTTFHRVNPTVIQGGDPLSKDSNPDNDGSGNSTKPNVDAKAQTPTVTPKPSGNYNKPNVDAEFSDIPYDSGIVGAARMEAINTANSQFFITLRREPQFDEKYTVFGKVIDGMNNARTIAGAPRDRDRPLEPTKIKTITIQPKQ